MYVMNLSLRTVLSLYLLFSGSLPAQAYWQQHTATRISVTLDDHAHMLYGLEEIRYTNNAPDTLHYLYFHLWPNAYKDDRTQFCEQLVQQGNKDFYFAAEEDRGYIDSLRFSIDGEGTSFDYVDGNSDIIRLELSRPLPPGSSVDIRTPFRVKIPKVFSRLGHNGQAYFISQWFPKPAVYDHAGWHPLPYLDQGEFYSEIGSYDVSITLPANYRLMATGNCLSESERLWMDSLSRLPFPADTVYRNTFPASDAVYKTVRFSEDNIHDFAWFADKRWIIRQQDIQNGKDSVRQITTAFLPQHQKQWERANSYLEHTLNAYDSMVGPYPYRTLKGVEGDMVAGSGMEYPTVFIVNKAESAELPMVSIHETGHNWFYGVLASNERAFPWMDEGLNTFFERKTMHLYQPGRKTELADRMNEMMYLGKQSMNEDLPVSLPAAAYDYAHYGADVYYKSSDLIGWLEQYMGAARFSAAIHEYYDLWKHKHPYPEDFREVMQRHCERPLGWFFDGVLKGQGKNDVRLRQVKRDKDTLEVMLVQKSGIAIPSSLAVMRGDSVMARTDIPPFHDRITVKMPRPGQWDRVVHEAFPAEYKLANNEYMNRFFFPRWKLDIGAGAGLSHDRFHHIYIAPAEGYNTYNGAGLGLLLHNLGMPQYRLQFVLAPLYSFGSKTVNGVGGLAYSWFPRRVFREIRAQLNVKSFAQGRADLNIASPLYSRYIKYAPSLELVFKPAPFPDTRSNALLMRQYTLQEQYFEYEQGADSLFRPGLRDTAFLYFAARFVHANKRAFHPYSYEVEAQSGPGFVKLGLTADLRIDYDVRNKSLYIRAYGGKLLSTGASAIATRYWLNTTFTGRNDYLYDGTFFGRNEQEGFFSRQVSIQEGGGKLPTNLYAAPVGRSDNWLLSVNLKTDLPLGKLPVRLYADVSTFADARFLNPSGSALLFSAGLELHLFRELLCIYAPLVMSREYQDYYNSLFNKNRFLNRLSFALNIQHLNFMRSNQYVFRRMTE